MESSSQYVTTNKPTPIFLQARCPSCRPTNNVEALKGKYHIPWTFLPPSWGLPTLSLTTNSSWLPWGRVVLPLISPLMPVPQVRIKLNIKLNYSNFYSTMRLQIQRRWAHLNDLPRVAARQCGSQESNPRSVDCKSSALTTTLPHTHTHQNLTYLLACFHIDAHTLTNTTEPQKLLC